MESRVLKIFLRILAVVAAGIVVAVAILVALAVKKNMAEEFDVQPAGVPTEATDSAAGVVVGKPFPISISAELAFAFDAEPQFFFELPEGLEAVEKKLPCSGFAWTHRRIAGEVFLIAFREGEFSDAKIKIRATRSGTAEFVEREIELPEIFAKLPETAADAELALAAERIIAGDSGDNRAPIVVAIAIVVVAAAIAFLILRRNNKKITPAPPPWIVATDALSALKDDVAAGRASAISAVARLSDIVRRYLAKRFSVSADAMTTPEFFATMERGDSPLSQAHRRFLHEFLTDADRVKFAGVSATSTQALSAIERAATLVKETTPVPQNPAENAAGKGGAR